MFSALSVVFVAKNSLNSCSNVFSSFSIYVVSEKISARTNNSLSNFSALLSCLIVKAVGHFTILNPRIENGVFKGELFDIYDFEWINLDDLDNIKGVIANNIAFLLQIIRLKNYYFLIPIEFIW